MTYSVSLIVSLISHSYQANLDSCRRVVLLMYQRETDTILFRHYAVDTSPVGLNKSVKRVIQRRVQDLSDYHDISDYVLEYALLPSSLLATHDQRNWRGGE